MVCSTTHSTIRIVGPEELAQALGTSVSYLRKRIYTHPQQFPPRIRIPGSNRLSWRLSTVNAWLDQLEGKGGDNAQA